MSDPKASRGYRNKNPGNIDWNKANDWDGQVGREPTGTPPRFAVFATHEHGIRALAVLLTNYQLMHNLWTVEKMISRWCPPKDLHAGAQNTAAYVAHVCKLTGWARGEVIDMKLYSDARPMVTAIITHECGGNPYDDATIDRGLEMARIRLPY